MALMKCPECGKEISDKSKRCVHCGYVLKNNHYNIIIAGTCIIIGVVLLIVVGFMLPKQKEQIKDQIFENVTENTDNIIVVTESDPSAKIYSDNDVSISLSECQYTEDVSDIRIVLNVDNNSNNILAVGFSDIMIDHKNVNMRLGNESEYQPGGWGSNFYILKDDVESIRATNFEEITCTIYGKYESGEDLFSKELTIERGACVSYQEY